MFTDSTRNIWTAIAEVERDHGDAAEGHARKAAASAIAAGDAESAAMWEEAATALHVLHSINSRPDMAGRTVGSNADAPTIPAGGSKTLKNRGFRGK